MKQINKQGITLGGGNHTRIFIISMVNFDSVFEQFFGTNCVQEPKHHCKELKFRNRVMKIKFTFAMIAADTWSGVVSSILGTAVEDCVETAIPVEDLLTEYTMLADGKVGTDTLIVLTSGGH